MRAKSPQSTAFSGQISNRAPVTTEEQRRAALEAAREAAQKAREARKTSPLRRDFADAPLWETRARLAGVRLSAWGIAPTPGRMRRLLARLGVGVEDYLTWTAERTLRDFAARNPLWPSRAWEGLCLERFRAVSDEPIATRQLQLV